MKVIENEFEDKDYVREFPFGRYSLDFAWPHKKVAIEIDGDQHQRFQVYIDRDLRKDSKLRDEGWKVLRISWKEMCRNTKAVIEEAKSFTGDDHGNSDHLLVDHHRIWAASSARFDPVMVRPQRDVAGRS